MDEFQIIDFGGGGSGGGGGGGGSYPPPPPPPPPPPTTDPGTSDPTPIPTTEPSTVQDPIDVVQPVSYPTTEPSTVQDPITGITLVNNPGTTQPPEWGLPPSGPKPELPPLTGTELETQAEIRRLGELMTAETAGGVQASASTGTVFTVLLVALGAFWLYRGGYL